MKGAEALGISVCYAREPKTSPNTLVDIHFTNKGKHKELSNGYSHDCDLQVRNSAPNPKLETEPAAQLKTRSSAYLLLSRSSVAREDVLARDLRHASLSTLLIDQCDEMVFPVVVLVAEVPEGRTGEQVVPRPCEIALLHHGVRDALEEDPRAEAAHRAEHDSAEHPRQRRSNQGSLEERVESRWTTAERCLQLASFTSKKLQLYFAAPAQSYTKSYSERERHQLNLLFEAHSRVGPRATEFHAAAAEVLLIFPSAMAVYYSVFGRSGSANAQLGA